MFFKVGLFILIVSCLARGDEAEEEFLNALNVADNERSVYLFGGLSIEKVSQDRSYDHSQLTIQERVQEFCENHELKWGLSAFQAEEEGRSSQSSEPRTRRLKKLLLPLFLALKLKMGVVIPLMLMLVKFISLKAFATGLLALFFAGTALLKDLIAKKKDFVTTAYITGAPLNAEILHADWNRNGQASAQELAYGYHTIPQPTL